MSEQITNLTAKRTKYKGASVAQFLDRAGAMFGRGSAADLPRLMRTLRQYRRPLQLPINIVGFGSSVGVGATLANPAADAPVNYFTARLKALLDPAGVYNIAVTNQCVNGSVASEFPEAWTAMTDAGITPTVVVLAYGMNDQAPASFNAGQTFPGFVDAMRDAVITAKKAGADVIILTTPHPAIVTHPEMHSMPDTVPQTYPTNVAAPVDAEAMDPPASQSTMTADFIGEGTAISVGHRAWRVNQAMRDIANEQGCTLIDAERYWFAALQKYQASTGSAAGAEAVMFNEGEVVHPNIVGHTEAYHKPIDEFLYAMAKQGGQSNTSAPINGYLTMNTREWQVTNAALTVSTPYADTTTPPVDFTVNIGVPDGSGVRAPVSVFKIDPATGDLLVGGGAWRFQSNLVNNGTTVAYGEWLVTAYGVKGNAKWTGAYNVEAGAAWSPAPIPDNAVGEMWISGQNNGVGTSPQFEKYSWTKKAGVLTISADRAAMGSGVFVTTVSAGEPVVTPTTDNTNLQVKWEVLATV